jgi:His-Xaa-Ser system protein HxsD
MFQVHTEERSVSLLIDTALYPIDAIYSASYVFIDRAFVFLSSESHHQVKVSLTARKNASGADLELLAGDFAHELLAQVIRAKLAQAHQPIAQKVLGQAFAAQDSTATIDALLAELARETPPATTQEDPLNVGVAWEPTHV